MLVVVNRFQAVMRRNVDFSKFHRHIWLAVLEILDFCECEKRNAMNEFVVVLLELVELEILRKPRQFYSIK